MVEVHMAASLPKIVQCLGFVQTVVCVVQKMNQYDLYSIFIPHHATKQYIRKFLLSIVLLSYSYSYIEW